MEQFWYGEWHTLHREITLVANKEINSNSATLHILSRDHLEIR